MECAFSREDKRLEAGRDGYTVGYLLQVVGGRYGTGDIGILPALPSPCDVEDVTSTNFKVAINQCTNPDVLSPQGVFW